MLKTMNAGQAAPLVNDGKTAGASFLEVLAGTSAHPSALPGAVAAAVPGQSSSANSDVAAQGNQASPQPGQQSVSQQTPYIENQAPAQASLPQASSTIAPVTPKSLAAQLVPVLKSPASSQAGKPADKSTASVDSNGHKEKSQATATPVPVEAPATPPPPATLPAAVVLPQVVAVPFPAPDASSKSIKPVTPDAVNAQGAVSTSQPPSTPAKVLDSKAAALPSTLTNVPANPPSESAVSTPVNAHASATPHSDDPVQEKSQGQVAKADDAKSTADTTANTQATNGAPSTPANTTPAGNSNAPIAFNPLLLPNDLNLPASSAPAYNGNVNQVTTKPAQAGKAADATLAKLPDMATAADAKKGGDASANAPTTNAPSPSSTANNHQMTQRPQADPSPAAPVSAKSSDGDASQLAAQVQAIANHIPMHEATAAPTSHAETVPVAAHSSDRMLPGDAGETVATPGINTANLIQKMSETEMRVGMRTADFGDVSIRTMVSQQQMTAQISVDHGDLGKAISAHIPAMEAKLGGDLGLRAMVEVNQSGMSFSGDRGFNSQRDQRSTQQPAQHQNTPIFAEADHVSLRMPIAAISDAYRLDIRA